MAWQAAVGGAMEYGGKATKGVGSYYTGGVTYLTSLESASLLKEQATLSREDYYKQANLVLEDSVRVRSKQAMDYIASGVELSGTALLVLKETATQGRAQSANLRATGRNTEVLLQAQAKIKKQEGIAGLVSGIIGGMSGG